MSTRITRSLAAIASFILLSSCSRVISTRLMNEPSVLKLRIPRALTDAVMPPTPDGQIYSDSAKGIVLVVTERESMFNSVDDYLNCSWKNIGSKLKVLSEDSSFIMLNCIKTKRSTELIYSVDPEINRYPYCILYFVHRRKSEMQFSFLFKNSSIKADQRYARRIMRTMRYYDNF